ncbi:MAG: hypothetical protein QE269_13100, partial [Fimbriimonas sp.]|nr:hypothetical protein [Fimbriimonas sp.]
SSRLRAAKLGDEGNALHTAAIPYLNLKAAEARQLLSEEPLTLPKSEKVDYAALAELVHHHNGPARFN